MKRLWLSSCLSVSLTACAGGAQAEAQAQPDVQGAAALAAVEVEEVESAQVEPASPKLVVHEWGTFTARVDARGNLLTWTQRDRVDPLPKFVHESWMTDAKQAARGTVRMETPVLYFYASEPTHASATVEFPGGFLTEWYPSAVHEDTTELARLSWPSFEIVPGPDPEYPVDGDSHYYAARQTGASPLEVAVDGRVEHEKLLFYRGVGSFALPLDGRVTKAGIELAATTKLTGVIVLNRRGDKLGFELLKSLEGPQVVEQPAAEGSDEPLRAELHRLLVAQGLYDEEASAMIETWRELWFADGLRVLYMVPRELTDQVLPLTLEPAPDELVRVLVGRLDMAG